MTRKTQRGPLLPSIVMVLLATVATGLLAVIGFQALPDSVIPSTFGGNDHGSRNVRVSDTPTPGAPRTTAPATKPSTLPSTAAPVATRTGISGETTRPANPDPGTVVRSTTTAPQPPPRTTAPPKKTTSPSPTSTKTATPTPTQTTQAPTSAPSCGTGRKPKCPTPSPQQQQTAAATSSPRTTESYVYADSDTSQDAKGVPAGKARTEKSRADKSRPAKSTKHAKRR